MLDIYGLVSVVPRLPLTIESLAAYEDKIVVGTKEGHVLMYRAQFRGEFSKDGIETANPEIIRSSKNFSKKPVTQLAVVPEHRLLICLSDNTVSIHDLHSPEGSDKGNFPLLETLSKTKGATMFALCITRDKYETNVNMCVVVRHRLLVFYLKAHEKKFEELTNVKLAFPDAPKGVVWVKDTIYFCMGGEYQKVKLNGEFERFFSIDRNQEPKILPLPDGRIALGRDEKCIFTNADGTINSQIQEPLKWSGVPEQIAVDAPFLFALFPNHVEIRSYDPPGKGPDSVQRVEIAKARWVCEGNTKGIIFIASPTAIWALKAAPTAMLIEKLLMSKQFSLAENIAKYSLASDSDKQEWTLQIQNIHAHQMFCDGEYRSAFSLYLQLGVEPPAVIGLLPRFLPVAQTRMTYPEKTPELTGAAQEKATFALIEYLTEWRQKLIQESNRRGDGRSGEEMQKSQDLMQIVDTTLLKCYVEVNPALVTYLLRLSDNHCNLEESERSLMAKGKNEELVLLYKSKNQHKKALEFLKKQVEDPKQEGHSPHIRMALYMVEIAKDELDLVLQYAKYVIRKDPEEGLKIFTDELYECEQIPRDKVFEFINRNSPELVVPYLEHVINVWNDKTDAFHTTLGEAYIKNAAALIRSKGDPALVTSLRQKLQLFLSTSENYTPAVLLTHIPLDCMFEERALVLGRMGRFAQAIGLYVHVLKDDEKAERFCEQFYDAKNLDASQVYYLLFKTYVQPPEPSTLGVLLNDLPTTERKLEEALKILRSHGARIEYAKGMELVPTTVSVQELADFLVTALQVLTARRRQVELMRSLHYAEYLQIEYRRIMRESEYFVLTEDDICEICNKRIGKNTAFIRTPAKQLRHYACGTTAKR